MWGLWCWIYYKKWITYTHFICSWVKKPFKCEFCDLSFARKAVLDNHTAAVHEQRKPFICNIFSKSFKLKGKLTRHTSEVHERKTSLQCRICDRSYTRKQKLNAHIEAIHEEKKFDCKLCGAKYGSKQQRLRFRKLENHNNITSILPPLPDIFYSV